MKDVAGLPLTKLFVGSEGTLGIVTEIVLRLLPAPRPPSTLVATFSSKTGAAGTVVEVSARLRLSMLEFMDKASINAVEDLTHMGLDRAAEALLVVQLAYGEVMVLAMRLGGTITGEHGVGRLTKPWLAEHLGPEALELNHRSKAALDPHGILNPGSCR